MGDGRAIMTSDARIFISYARSDGRDFSRELNQRLAKENLRIWRDLQDLQDGERWWEQIQKVITSSDLEHLILVMTPSALKSGYVRDEWRIARREGKNVIPVIGSRDLDLRARILIA